MTTATLIAPSTRSYARKGDYPVGSIVRYADFISEEDAEGNVTSPDYGMNLTLNPLAALADAAQRPDYFTDAIEAAGFSPIVLAEMLPSDEVAAIDYTLEDAEIAAGFSEYWIAPFTLNEELTQQDKINIVDLAFVRIF